MSSLRAFLSNRHQRAFTPWGIIDRVVDDPQVGERMHYFMAQVTAAYGLRSALEDIGVEVRLRDRNSLDLCPLAQLARHHQLITRVEYRILMEINDQANTAKHQVRFPSRL